MGANLTGKSLAEFMGTFAIVFFGAGAVCVNSQFPGSLGLLGISAAFGLVVAVMVSSVGHVSGAHFNPAVTLMCTVTRRTTPALAAVYIASQLAGATLAAFVLKATFGADHGARVNLGATGLAPGLTPLAGLAIEAIMTFFLVTVIFGTAIDQRGHKLGGLAIGAVVCLDILIAGPLTGASMNPARSFGPALAGGFWDNHWIYWAGPILGAVAAAGVYEKLMAPAPAATLAPAAPVGAQAVR